MFAGIAAFQVRIAPSTSLGDDPGGRRNAIRARLAASDITPYRPDQP